MPIGIATHLVANHRVTEQRAILQKLALTPHVNLGGTHISYRIWSTIAIVQELFCWLFPKMINPAEIV
jgi:hypothetical protein